MTTTLPAPALRRGDPGFRRVAVGLFFAGFTTFALLYATQPLLPRLVDVDGLTPGTASLSVSVTTGALALAVIPASTLSERWGRRPVMVASLGAAVVLGVASALAPSWGLLLVLRALEGLALAGLPAVGMAYLADEIDPSDLGAAMGLYVAGNSVGGFGGRVVVGVLADVTGSWRWALGGIAAVSALCLVAFVAVLPRSRRFTPTPEGLGDLARTAGTHLRDSVLARLYLVGLLAMGVFVTAYNYIAFLLLARFRLPEIVVGFVFVLYAVGTVTSTRAGRLADRVGAHRVLLGAVGVSVVGVAATLAGSVVLVVAGLAVLTVGFFATHTVASSWVGHRAAHGRAVASGLYLFAYYVGSSVGGTAGGAAYGAGGWPATVVFMLVLLALTASVGWSLRPSRGSRNARSRRTPTSGAAAP